MTSSPITNRSSSSSPLLPPPSKPESTEEDSNSFSSSSSSNSFPTSSSSSTTQSLSKTSPDFFNRLPLTVLTHCAEMAGPHWIEPCNHSSQQATQYIHKKFVNVYAQDSRLRPMVTRFTIIAQFTSDSSLRDFDGPLSDISKPISEKDYTLIFKRTRGEVLKRAKALTVAVPGDSRDANLQDVMTGVETQNFISFFKGLCDHHIPLCDTSAREGGSCGHIIPKERCPNPAELTGKTPEQSANLRSLFRDVL